MNPKYFLVVLTLLALLALAGGVSASASQTTSEPQDGGLMFVENRGQFDPQVRFQAQGDNGVLWVTDDGLWVSMVETLGGGNGKTQRWGEAERMGAPMQRVERVGRGVALKLSFVGAMPQAIEPFELLATELSYFLGNDPARWVSGAPAYAGVRYVDLYPGIDLELSGVGGQLAPRLVVRDPAALAQVRMRVEGGEGVSVVGGRMVVETGLGQVALPLLAVEGAAVAAALPGAAMPEVAAADGGGFEVAAPFALSEAALLDDVGAMAPSVEVEAAVATTIIFSTFLGGNDYDIILAITADASKNTYVCGETNSANFPTKTGAYDTGLSGANDAFVSKYDSTGKFVGGTLLGGSGSEGCGGLRVSGAYAYVTGDTFSGDFPTTGGAFDTSYNGGGDVFVSKLSSTLQTLPASTFLGGADYDVGEDMALDGSGNVYVAGSTNSGDFPTTDGTAQPEFGGLVDAFVARLNAGLSSRVWATYLGGADWELPGGIAMHGSEAYVAGTTVSSDFPKTAGAFDQTYNGDYDGFVTRLNANGGLRYSTFLGASDSDFLNDVAIDSSGRAHVIGDTWSTTYPKTANAAQGSLGGYVDTVLTVLNATGSVLVYSTFYGGSDYDSGVAIALDGTPNTYIAGITFSTDLPTKDPYQTANKGEHDAFLAKFAAAGSGNLLYGTYLGGSGSDSATDVSLDAHGYVALSGITYSSNFPRVNAADNSPNGGADGFVTRLALAPLMTTSFQDGVLPTTAYAGTRDTFISQNSPAVNFGAAVTLKVDGDDPNGSGKDLCTLIKWDLTAIPSSATLTSASIVISVSGHSNGQVYELYTVKQAWDEMAATWDNQPAHGTKVLGKVGMSALGLYTINLNAGGKSEVQGWIDAPATNEGFFICDPTNTNGLDFDSSEAATKANRPKLTLSWVHPAVTTSAPAEEPLLEEGAPEAGWQSLWLPLVHH